MNDLSYKMIRYSIKSKKRLTRFGSRPIRCLSGALLIMLIGLIGSSTPAERKNSLLEKSSATCLIVPGRVIVQFQLDDFKSAAASSFAKAAIVASDQKLSLVWQQIFSTRLEPLFNPNLLQKLKKVAAIDEFFLLDYETDLTFAQVERLLRTVPQVINVEPVRMIPLLIDPTDTYYSLQYYLPQIQAPAAWNTTQGDSAVVIAIVDNGFDLQHPDLSPNYWTNQLEANGQPGIDDDGNGLVDDVHGYDFADNDPDATYGSSSSTYYVHGTHVAGIAAAVGNNQLGVAGIAWKSRILPVKASNDDDPQYILSDYAYRGIQYAIAQGAKVINLSWGSYGDSSPAENTVLNLAYQNGVVVVAAAGNEKTDHLLYPASSHHVISVAGVNKADQKASFSDFGKAVDLVAPAVSIFSTLPGGNYGYLEGTSMATPIVVGVTALVWAYHPSWTVDQVIRQVVFTADNIDNLNPSYENQLGSGRVNAEQALLATQLPSPPAKMILQAFVVNDSLYGNGNQIIEADETVALFVKLSNVSLGTSSGLQVELTAPDSLGLIWQKQTVSIAVPADSDMVLSEPFVFSSSLKNTKGFIPLVIHFSGPNVLADNDSLVLPVGRAPILLVDDDDGETNVEDYYIQSLADANIPYSYWDYQKLGEPPANYLQQFPIVIWFCEWAYPSLTPGDRSLLGDYLGQKGGLFLSGQDIGWDLADPASENATAAAQDFYHDWLHADYIADDAEESRVTGELGSVVGDDLSFTIYQPGREVTYQYPEVIQPLIPAKPIWNYASHKGVGGLLYQDNYRLTYFGFGLEAINARYNSKSTDPNPVRAVVLQRVMNFLHPLRFHPISDRASTVTTMPVQAKYVGCGQLPQGVRCYYRLPTDTLFKSVQLQSTGNDFSCNLNLNGQVGVVQYYFEIIDPVFTWYLPVAGAEQPFSFRVGEDVEPPVITVQNPGAQLALLPEYSVSALIRDNTALDSTSVWLLYRKNRAVIDSSLMIYQPTSDLFSGTIAGDFAYGDTLTFWLWASDQVQPANLSQTKPALMILGLDDFESGLDRWQTPYGDWGLDTTRAFSGKYALKTTPYGSYANNLSISITTKEWLDFSRARQAELQFHSRFAIESGDAGYVEIKTAENNWQMIAGPFSGFQSGWKLTRINLAPFVGQSRCALRFRFESDTQQSVPLSGWVIDQVRLVQDDYITQIAFEESAAPPANFSLSAAYPNPFSERTQFDLTLPAKTKVTISVFNLLGQEVTRLILGELPAGRNRFDWDGQNHQSERLPAGVYLLQVRAGESCCIKKIILLK